eukprot:TRINITY_DN371_c0_g1_i4.p1 TRINITY_DN371_c0_g1~~TRINITY_DN371_c0_g1_i4.p1  ORF type:complete len:170 (+),score=2.76 TRINITY_DN371_c0_g1_i4:194-703(+)
MFIKKNKKKSDDLMYISNYPSNSHVSGGWQSTLPTAIATPYEQNENELALRTWPDAPAVKLLSLSHLKSGCGEALQRCGHVPSICQILHIDDVDQLCGCSHVSRGWMEEPKINQFQIPTTFPTRLEIQIQQKKKTPTCQAKADVTDVLSSKIIRVDLLWHVLLTRVRLQ